MQHHRFELLGRGLTWPPLWWACPLLSAFRSVALLGGGDESSRPFSAHRRRSRGLNSNRGACRRLSSAVVVALRT
jgi:hypothetical protein